MAALVFAALLVGAPSASDWRAAVPLRPGAPTICAQGASEDPKRWSEANAFIGGITFVLRKRGTADVRAISLPFREGADPAIPCRTTYKSDFTLVAVVEKIRPGTSYEVVVNLSRPGGREWHTRIKQSNYPKLYEETESLDGPYGVVIAKHHAPLSAILTNALTIDGGRAARWVEKQIREVSNGNGR